MSKKYLNAMMALVCFVCMNLAFITELSESKYLNQSYFENFEDGMAQGWDLESGWEVVEENGNHILKGRGHAWAYSNQSCSDGSVSFRLKVVKGRIHLVFRLNDSGRYFISFDANGSTLHKQYWPDTFLHNLKGADFLHSADSWHTVAIEGQGNSIKLVVDGKTEWIFDDTKAILDGRFAFETLEDSQAYLDEISVTLGVTPSKKVVSPTTAPIQKPGASASWIRTGGPLGGLGYDVRIDPEKVENMYVSDAWAGIFISTTAGASWIPSNQGINARTGATGDGIPIFCVTIDPKNPNIIWTGTQNIRGIYKSTDYGKTWKLLVKGIVEADGITFRGFTVDPNDSDIVYAAAEISSWSGGRPGRNGREFDLTRGVVYKTVDGGKSWKAVWRGENLARYIWIDPRDTNVLYISTGIFDREANNSDPIKGLPGGEGVLKSTDGGKSWKRINNGLKNLYVGTLFMHPTNADILLAGTGNNQYMENMGAYLTTDGGATWTHVLRDQVITSVEFAVSNPSIAYAGSSNKVFRSDDGGRNWKTTSGSMGFGWGSPGVRAGFPIDFQVDPENPNRLFVNAYGGGNFLSEDGGVTWSDASRGYTGAQVRAIAVRQDQPSVIFAAARSGIFKSSDGGNIWAGQNFPEIVTMEWNAVAIDPGNANHIIGSTNWSNILANSTDGGKSWTNTLSLMGTRVGFSTIAFSPSNLNTIYVGTAGYYSAGSFDPSQKGKGIYKSQDSGKTWIESNNALSRDAYVASIAVNPSDDQVVYAATENHGLLKTMDGGKNWQIIKNGLPTISASAVAIHPTNARKIAVGFRRRGFYLSNDGGQTWKHITKGIIPEANISSIVFDPRDPDNVIYAADLFSGVYRSMDGGNGWASINNGLIMRSVNALAISGDGKHLYAATEGGGVYRLDMDQKPPA